MSGDACRAPIHLAYPADYVLFQNDYAVNKIRRPVLQPKLAAGTDGAEQQGEGGEVDTDSALEGTNRHAVVVFFTMAVATAAPGAIVPRPDMHGLSEARNGPVVFCSRSQR